jgi:hypothetical protein
MANHQDDAGNTKLGVWGGWTCYAFTDPRRKTPRAQVTNYKRISFVKQMLIYSRGVFLVLVAYHSELNRTVGITNNSVSILKLVINYTS